MADPAGITAWHPCWHPSEAVSFSEFRISKLSLEEFFDFRSDWGGHRLNFNPVATQRTQSGSESLKETMNGSGSHPVIAQFAIKTSK